jgi:NAD(P)H-dependent flavin oxidoreductase YrpB (nitropropane dioxygenase family)
MLHTPVCDLLGIDVPIVLGGMGTGTSPALVAAVCEAGGMGTQGLWSAPLAEIPKIVEEIRRLTSRPFAVNFLLFLIKEDQFAAALAEKPAVVAFAWPRGDQDLRPWISKAHAAGAKVMVQAHDVPLALKAKAAGADIIVAQGSEGGGHVGWMGTLPLVPMMVDAVSPLPVLAAGGIADGRGVAAALALGAQGALIGTRFLATPESPLPQAFKDAIVASDGHDTVLSEIPDIAQGQVWPGAMARSLRNRFIDKWAGRESALRQNQAEVKASIVAARQAGDVENGVLFFGQDAGLIPSIRPAGELVRQMAEDAARILGGWADPVAAARSRR